MPNSPNDERLGTLQDSVTERRRLPAPPDEVMTAFADIARRRQWFRIPGEKSRRLDFWIGGGERIRAETAVSGSAETIEYASTFLDIVEGERIVYAYRSQVNGRTHTVALVTVVLADEGDGSTTITYSDQHSLFLYPGDDPTVAVAHHQGGIRLMLNGLTGVLRRAVLRATEALHD